MKTILLFSKTILAMLVLTLVTGNTAMAATYTAAVSGNWSSSTTWGGTAPGFNITGSDMLVIPVGVVVTLDNSLTLSNAASSLAVAGSLTGTTNLALTSGTLTGTGTVALNTLTVGTGGHITSTGAISVSQFANSQATLALGTVVNVSSTVVLTAGVVQLNTGSAINLAGNGTINLAGGSYSLVAGLLNLAGNYNLVYSGAATTIGAEASLLGLQNVTVNLTSATSQLDMAANLTVTGLLSLQQGVLNLNGNSLTLNGGINTSSTGSILGNVASSIVVNGTGSVGTLALASAGQTIHNLTLNIGASGSILLASNITVAGVLSLTGSSLNLNGYNLAITGTISSLVGGSITGNSASNITFSGTGPVGTLVMSSMNNTVGNLTVDIAATGTVLLGSNLSVSGVLTTTAGTLDLNGQSLTIAGSVAASGTGSITGNLASNITLNGLGNAGTLALSAIGQTINNLTVNIGSSGTVALGSNMTIAGTLTMAQGNIVLGTHDLTLAATGSLQGGSANSYAVTSDTGSLIMTVANAGVSGTFQVGTMANYAPVTVTNNSTLSGQFSVLARSGVLSAGTTGTDISIGQPVVNTSWEVSSSLIVGTNVNLQMNWSTAMQVNGFDNTHAYVSHYTGGAWNTNALTAATAQAGSYSLSLTGVTSFSPFAIFDRNTATAIDNVKAIATFQLYPNPATSTLEISGIETGKTQNMRVYDMMGNQIISQQLEKSNTAVDISNLAPGVYCLSVNNGTKTFIKE